MTILPIGSAGEIPTWTIADRLRKARETAGLEQAELALRTGMARGTISAAENGRRVPSKTNINLWALATGVPAPWILNGDTPPTPQDDKRSRLSESNRRPSHYNVYSLSTKRAAA